MRKVLKNSSEVIHYFANQIQNEGKNQSRNIYFEGKSLFSYGSHYKLAQILTPKSVLINDVGYSVTTSKHIHETRHATRHLTRFFSSEVFLKNALIECESLAQKIPFARSNKLNHINRIKRLYNKVIEFDIFCKENKIDFIRWSNHEKINTKLDKRSKDFKRLSYLYNSLANIEMLESEIKAQKQREKAKREREQKQLIKGFREFKRYFVRLDYDILRIETCKRFVLTSQNVRIDIQEAKKLLLALESLKYNQEAINTTLRGNKISHYIIKGAKDNSLVVGCHRIKFDEIKAIANQIKSII